MAVCQVRTHLSAQGLGWLWSACLLECAGTPPVTTVRDSGFRGAQDNQLKTGSVVVTVVSSVRKA